MNYSGSYRRLFGNAVSALLAAIEIFNKPKFEYRKECFVILLMNAWELLLKAILSKARESIYYRKKRNSSYRTLSWQDAFSRIESKKLFPATIDVYPLRRNLEALNGYRNNAIHFYNEQGFEVLIVSLAQSSIMRLMHGVLGCFACKYLN